MLLTLMIVIPLLAGLAMLLMPRSQATAAQQTALVVSILVALLGLTVAIVGGSQLAGGGDMGGNLWLTQSTAWMGPAVLGEGDMLPPASIDLRYHVGIDGISLWLIVAASLLGPVLIASSWDRISKRTSEYFALLLILLGALVGTFAARDLLLFFIFFEFTLIPLYLLIGGWGEKHRLRAAMVTFLYTFTGSMFLLAGILYLAYLSSTWAGSNYVFSFDLATLKAMVLADDSPLDATTQWWLFGAFFLGFAVKVPLWPLHTWLPDAHEQAASVGSVDMALVMLKLGVYGFIQFCLPLLPAATLAWAPAIAVLCLVGIIAGGLIAWQQPTMKGLLAYSSVSHLSMCVLGIFSLTFVGAAGATLYIVNYVLISGALFLLVGMLHARFGTLAFADLGGLAKAMPAFGFFFVFFAMCSVALPLTNGFVSEYMVLLGAFLSSSPSHSPILGGGPLSPAFAVIAALGVVIAAVYLLHMVRSIAFGPLKYPGFAEPPQTAQSSHESDGDAIPADKPLDLTTREIAIIAPIALVCLFIGCYPKMLMNSIAPSSNAVVAQVAAYHEAQLPAEERVALREARDAAVQARLDAATARPRVIFVEQAPPATQPANETATATTTAPGDAFAPSTAPATTPATQPATMPATESTAAIGIDRSAG